MLHLEKSQQDEIYRLKNLALEASSVDQTKTSIGPFVTKNSRAIWKADQETLGDSVFLGSTRRYLGQWALRSIESTFMYIKDYESGTMDEYCFDFVKGTVKIHTAIRGYSLKDRVQEIRAAREELKFGFNDFDEQRQQVVITELQRGASGLYVFKSSNTVE